MLRYSPVINYRRNSDLINNLHNLHEVPKNMCMSGQLQRKIQQRKYRRDVFYCLYVVCYLYQLLIIN